MINRASLSFLDDRTVISLFVQTKDEPASRTLFCDGKSVVEQDFSPVVQVEGAGTGFRDIPFQKTSSASVRRILSASRPSSQMSSICTSAFVQTFPSASMSQRALNSSTTVQPSLRC